MRIASIKIQEYTNRDIQQFVLLLEILSPNIKTTTDLEIAIEKSCTEFVKTKEGKRIYNFNCQNFNWADFNMYVPEDICKKYGFRKLKNPKTEMDFTVNWDKHLVDDEELEEEE